MNAPIDKIYSEPRPTMSDFNFGKETTAVFDDMVDRSVPFYSEIQRMVGELVGDFATDGSNIIDLGCATGTTLIAVEPFIRDEITNLRFIGIDNSTAMLEKAKEKLTAHEFRYKYDLNCEDLDHGVAISNASVVVMLLTLQFVRPLYRTQLVESIYRGLNANGALIIVEKVLGEDSTFNRLFIQHYYEMKKRHGYSEMEIAQKREALENVLVPYRLTENEQLLRRAGFRHVDIFFKWYNFCGIVAAK